LQTPGLYLYLLPNYVKTRSTATYCIAVRGEPSHGHR